MHQTRVLCPLESKTAARFARGLCMALCSMTERVDFIRQLIPLWHAEMAWAKELIARAIHLAKADDILRIRGRMPVPGTNWSICTHGIGVDVYRTPTVGGIDFDFDKPDPDVWRLQIFFEKQLNDWALDYSAYRELAENEELLISSIKEALDAA
jgi:hypothetical protein